MGRKNRQTDIFRSIDTKGNDPDVCWPWTASTSGTDGRGYFTYDGKRHLAYRVVYEIFNGPIPEGHVIRHSCDNPLCCNPKHLSCGTQSDNEHDKYDHDRAGYTLDMLKEIRRCEKLQMTYQAIANRVNQKFDTTISASGVGKVIRGERRRKQS